MESFLRKYKLKDTFDVTLNCNKEVFIEKFKENVEPSDLSYSPFEVFNNRAKLYKGNIANSSFKIQKIKQFSSGKKHHPVATGKITENINSIKLTIDINGVNSRMKFFIVFTGLFLLLSLVTFIFLITKQNGTILPLIPIFLLQTAFMLSIPFFIIRSSVKNFKQELEREIHYWFR